MWILYAFRGKRKWVQLINRSTDSDKESPLIHLCPPVSSPRPPPSLTDGGRGSSTPTTDTNIGPPVGTVRPKNTICTSPFTGVCQTVKGLEIHHKQWRRSLNWVKVGLLFAVKWVGVSWKWEWPRAQHTGFPLLPCNSPPWLFQNIWPFCAIFVKIQSQRSHFTLCTILSWNQRGCIFLASQNILSFAQGNKGTAAQFFLLFLTSITKPFLSKFSLLHDSCFSISPWIF